MNTTRSLIIFFVVIFALALLVFSDIKRKKELGIVEENNCCFGYAEEIRQYVKAMYRHLNRNTVVFPEPFRYLAQSHLYFSEKIHDGIFYYIERIFSLKGDGENLFTRRCSLYNDPVNCLLEFIVDFIRMLFSMVYFFAIRAFDIIL